MEYHVGLDASVLVSKSAGRYRVQSSSLEGTLTLNTDPNAYPYP